MKPFERILVPVDFSEHSREAVRAAVDLGRRYDASLMLVHVFEPAVYALPDGCVLFTPEQLARLFNELERQLEMARQEAVQLGAARVDILLLEGFAAGEIVDCSRGAKIDLIVMGTHGRTGPKHLLLGSVAERVVRHAPCAVLTVKASSTAGDPAGAPSVPALGAKRNARPTHELAARLPAAREIQARNARANGRPK